MKVTTSSAQQTAALAERIGSVLQGGEVIELVSDLGGGKTTFTRGLAKGLGVNQVVSSPTFTVSREYEGRLRLYHFDFYRLAEAGVMSDELAEAIADPEGVVVVEWADVVRGVLPEACMRIVITASGEDTRELAIAIPDQYAYVTEAIT